MWFGSVYLKTLRDFRIAIFGWGIGLGLLMYAVVTAISSVIATPEARASLVSLAGSFAWIAEPIKVDTAGGYATWKYGFTILVMALWPILVGSRMLRGEEERGSLDMLLSQPRGRGLVVLEKLAAMWTALLAMALLIGLLTYAGGARVNAEFTLSESLLFGLNLALICGVFGSIALLIAQFTQERRTASGITGGLLALFIVVDMIHRVIPDTDWISRLSPVYYYNLSKPLIPSYGSNPVAMLVMVALSVVLSGAAIWLFLRRDVGAPVALPQWLQPPKRAMRPEQALPVNAWSLRSVYTRSLATIAVPTFWWTVVIAGFSAWMIFIVQQTEQKLRTLYEGSPLLKDLLTKVGGGDVNTNATLLSFFFVFLPVLLMAFAVTQAGRWAADEEDGLQELVLATPQSRLSVVLARYAAVATATVIIAMVTLALTTLASAASGLALNGGNLAAASLSIIPLGLLMAALGYLFSGWLRAAVDTGLLSFLLVIWFFITFVGPELNWPAGVQRLSAFYYYGTPLLHGLPLGDMLLVLAITVVALALASARFVRKDIGR
ncbi:MAG: Efflux ABC transporter, permease protein [Ktedonobacterales bacterium]|jgi:ABC-2 type transport system permease protein|nr:MAG: Efflux ABC transporter, permease protein [Ktedonobacterales bacterium]